MSKILAADIGGTKTLLQITHFNKGDFDILAEQRYDSSAYQTFDQMLYEFIGNSEHTDIASACLAVAGPITTNGKTAYVTNLPWQIEQKKIQKQFSIIKVSLINDFHAVALGIDTLHTNEIISLQKGQLQQRGNQLIVGAGTGLGVAQRFWKTHGYQIQSTESGHAGFAPANETQQALLEFLAKDTSTVSREHILSGQGLIRIYRFICQHHGHMCQTLVDAGQLSQVANDPDNEDYKTSNEVFDLFFEVYGSEVGNLALTTLPFGGIYIAGGIAAKNIEALQRSKFIEAFGQKSKMAKLLELIPIHVITNEQVGLNGARLLASQHIK